MGKGKVPHPTGGEKLVQQQFKDQANVNNIMQKHLRSGMGGLQPPGRPGGRVPMFVSLTGKTYHEMLCQVQEVQGQFAGLPSRVRRRFANNPEQLIKFLEDPNNLEEAIKLGLVQEDDLSEEKKAQLDLVREAEAEDRRRYEEWKRKQRANAEETHDQPPWPDEQEEKIPPKKGGKRTS